jgi:hypothetical protein
MDRKIIFLLSFVTLLWFSEAIEGKRLEELLDQSNSLRFVAQHRQFSSTHKSHANDKRAVIMRESY